MYIVTLMADVDDGMMANVELIVNIQKVVKNSWAKTDFMMSAEDFHCDLDGCNLHYIEPCEICTKSYCEAHLPFCQHVWISPDNRREEYAKKQSSFYSDSYATETSDDNARFSGHGRPSSFCLDLADTHYQRQSSARSTTSSSSMQLSFSATPTISASRPTASSSTVPLSSSATPVNDELQRCALTATVETMVDPKSWIWNHFKRIGGVLLGATELRGIVQHLPGRGNRK
jgi:hypothetical protein